MGKTEEEQTGEEHPAPTATDHVKLQIDMENRDPNNLNDHVQARFSDLIGEPQDAHSDDCVWLNSHKAYKVGTDCCYTCLTYVCAIPLAFCWGCYFASLTFCHIWSITPWLRAFKINFSTASRFFSALVHCFCDPCYESLSLVFTKFYINVRHDAQEYRERTYSGLKHFSGPVEKGNISPLLSSRKNSKNSESRKSEVKDASASVYEEME